MKFYISTLGEFDIISEGKSILTGSSRTYRLYKLFEYFLTFRNKKLLPETIIDNLLSDSESNDPKNMLRTQIFRLRKVINSLIPEGANRGKYMNIKFTNGYYCLEIGENVIVDIDEFENYIEKAKIETNQDIAMNYYEKAIGLYRGLYLSNNPYEVWLMPTRNYYQRLYLKTLYKYIELLKENEEYIRILDLCEKTLLIEPYEENIHIEMMESLLNLGQVRAAANHYQHAMDMLEKEMDAMPSQRFLDFIKKIKGKSSYKKDLDTIDIAKDLEGEIAPGALYCNLEDFKFLYKIQKRKSIRDNQNDYLCIITIKGNESYQQREDKQKLKDIYFVLEKFLRQGDIFTSWKENQILLMLHNVKGRGVESIKERLISKMGSYAKISRNKININIQPLSQNINNPI